MASSTNIEWTDHTANPWWGCTKVSDGCKFCYAESWDKRVGGSHWGANAPRREVKGVWKEIAKWERRAQADGRRHRVFCASMADVFDENGPKDVRARLWRTIEENTHLDWQLLTKRPENIVKMVPPAWLTKPLPHVWYGTSVEDNRVCNRISILASVPAVTRFISFEPMIGPIDYPQEMSQIHWAIFGGESGGLLARKLDVSWVREGIAACRQHDVSVFVKQLGSVWARTNRLKDDKKGGDWASWPADLQIREFPDATTPPSAEGERQ